MILFTPLNFIAAGEIIRQRHKTRPVIVGAEVPAYFIQNSGLNSAASSQSLRLKMQHFLFVGK
jgi:hypothetical protein